MQNPKFKTWRNLYRLYIHAKSKIKSKKYHNSKCDISFKTIVMQNVEFYIGSNFNNLYFHAKHQIKSKKYYKIKYDTLLKSYGYTKLKICGLEIF